MDIIKMYIGNVRTTFNCDTQARLTIKRACRAKPTGYEYMPRFKAARWDGFINLATTTSIPTGLLGVVVPILREEGYKIEFTWTDNNPADTTTIIDPTVLHGITLRDYQVEACQTLLRAGRGIAKMATNSGKTAVIATLVHYMSGNSLVIVSGKDLLFQTAARLGELLSCEIALYGAGSKDIGEVTVATIQSLSRLSKRDLASKFGDIQAVFIDECHHGSAATYLRTLEMLQANKRFGFSGTPLARSTLDDLRLMSITGRQLIDVTNADLIDGGISAKPIVMMHNVNGKIQWDCKYHDAYTDLIVNNDERNAYIAKLAAAAGGVVLIIVNRIAHGNTLHALIDGSVFVNGSSSDEARKKVLADMQTKDGVYIATVIFDEGVDVPNIGTLINAAGGKSTRQLLQRIGRGLRKKTSGDNVVYVHDFIDDTNEHLLSHAEHRVDVYIAEGFQIDGQ